MKKDEKPFRLVLLLDKVAIAYLGLYLLGWLLERKWGMMLIVTALFSVGWAVMIIYFLYIFMPELYASSLDNGEPLFWVCTSLGLISAVVMVNYEQNKPFNPNQKL